MSTDAALVRKLRARILLYVLAPFSLGILVGSAEIADLGPGNSLATILTLIGLPLAALLVVMDIRALEGDTVGVVEEIAIFIHSAVLGGLLLSLMAVAYATGAALPVALAGESVRLFEGTISGWELMILLAFFAPLAAFPIGAVAGCIAWVSRLGVYPAT